MTVNVAIVISNLLPIQEQKSELLRNNLEEW